MITSETLTRLELFEGLPEENLCFIATLCHEVTFPEKAIIFTLGLPAERIYLLLEGTVRLTVSATPLSEPVTITVLNTPGQVLGWSAVISSGHYSSTAVAVTPVRAIAIEGQALMNYLVQDPCAGFEVMRRVAQVVSQRLGAMRKLLLETIVDYEKPAQATAEN